MSWKPPHGWAAELVSWAIAAAMLTLAWAGIMYLLGALS